MVLRRFFADDDAKWLAAESFDDNHNQSVNHPGRPKLVSKMWEFGVCERDKLTEGHFCYWGIMLHFRGRHFHFSYQKWALYFMTGLNSMFHIPDYFTQNT